jgi:hypothetical protein
VKGRRDRELERRLRELRAPDEAAAEERSLDVVRAAYADHVPLRPSRGTRRVGLAAGCAAVALAIGLSPAGAKVGDLVSDVFSPSTGEPHAKPQLRSLPAPGQLLVRSSAGVWVVRDDGSKRLLGDYSDATLSPHGLFVAAADRNRLVALEPDGTVRWTGPPARGEVRDPRWSPCCDSVGYRIVYRVGKTQHVIDADGTDDQVVARDVARIAAGWRARKDLAVTGSDPHRHVLSYVDARGGIRTVDTDTGERLKTSPPDMERMSAPPTGGPARVAVSPDGASTAIVVRTHHGYALIRQRDGSGGKTVLFSGAAPLTGPTWSPNGRWLLVGLPAADQWVFVRAFGSHRVIAVNKISEQFNPGRDRPGPFPVVAGWGPSARSD